MFDLIQLAASLRMVAFTVQKGQLLYEQAPVAHLGEKILQTVKDSHGDAGKLRSLEQSTQDSRSQQGYPANEPLLRDGEQRDSYDAVITSDPSGDGWALVIGSPLDKALWSELGFYNIPAGVYVPGRQVLMPAVLEHEAGVKQAFGEALVGVFGMGLSSTLPGSTYGLSHNVRIQ